MGQYHLAHYRRFEPEKHDAEEEINRLLANADREAHEIILAQKFNTDKLAKALLARETLTCEEVLDLLGTRNSKLQLQDLAG